MRCQCLVRFGAPLAQEERPTPVVSGTEVLLRVVANGVCHSDLHIREGSYDLGHGKRLDFTSRGMKLPLVMGHEPVGMVIDAGPEAGEIDRSRTYVVYPWQGCGRCTLCRAGREHLCSNPRALGVNVDGGYADMLKIPHPRYLFDIGNLDPIKAAPLACSGLTTYSALKKIEGTLKESPILIIGAGGLGLMAINLVKALGGVPPVVADISAEKRTVAVQQGAAHAIDAAAPDAAEQIRSAIGSSPAAVLDLVGAERTAELAFNVVGRGGKIVIVGLFGGAAPWPLPMIPVKALTIMGSYVGSLSEFGELMSLAVAGKVPFLPTVVRPLEAAESVLNDLSSGKIVGRAILQP